jgi:hypothetical protein
MLYRYTGFLICLFGWSNKLQICSSFCINYDVALKEYVPQKMVKLTAP